MGLDNPANLNVEYFAAVQSFAVHHRQSPKTSLRLLETD
jgi:hypothetical protein